VAHRASSGGSQTPDGAGRGGHLGDSGSTDAIAAQYGAKVEHIPPAEFTFGRSLNRGLAAATCDLVVIASAHIYPVYPDWLERLLEPFQDP